MATGLIRPVLEGLQKISTSFVSANSSFHLKAIPLRGNFAVFPREIPYSIWNSDFVYDMNGNLIDSAYSGH